MRWCDRNSSLGRCSSPEAVIMCCHFHSIPACLHAAPAPAMIFCRIVKKEYTSTIFALFDKREVAITEEVACRFCHWDKKMKRFVQAQVKMLLIPALHSPQFSVPGLLIKEPVNRRDR